MKALLVTTDNEVKLLDEDFHYERINELVGGWIEAVNFGDNSFFAYINEEGKIIGLPENKLATEFWYNSGQRILLGDYLAGNALFFGEVDDEGNNTDVPQEVIDHFIKAK